MVESLGLWEIPIPGESLASYAVRWADWAVVGGLRGLAKATGVNLVATRMTQKHLAALSAASELPVEQFEAMAYMAVDDAHIRFMGTEVKHEFVRVWGRRVCPECLRESGHHRMIWDLQPLSVCHLHRVKLISVCRQCKTQVAFDGPSPSICGCGADLSAMPTAPASDEDVAAVADVVDAFHRGFSGRASVGLDALPAGERLWVYMHLGRTSRIDAGKEKPLTGRRSPERHVLAARLRTGFAACRDWPHGLRRLLDDLRAKAPKRSGSHGLRKEFGHFYPGLDFDRRGAGVDLLRNAFSDYLRDHPDALPTRRRVRIHAGDHVGDPKACTQREALGKIGLSRYKFVRLAKTNGMDVTDETRHRDSGLVMVDRRAADRLAQRTGALIDKKELADRLGVSAARALEFVQAGFIPPVHARDAGFKTYAFSAAEFDAFMSCLEACVCGSTPPDRLVAFNFLSKRARHRGLDLAEVIKDVLNGKINPRAIDASQIGLHRLMFDREEVEDYAQELETASLGAVGVDAAARSLGVKREVIRSLIRSGLLPSIRAKATFREGARVRIDAMEAFKAAYVSAAELAAELGTSPKHLVAQLRRAGIEPVTGQQVDGTRQYFFRRDQVEEVGRAPLGADSQLPEG